MNNVKQTVLETLEFQAGSKGAMGGYKCGVAARKTVSITENVSWVTSIILLVSATFFSLKSQFGSVVERTKEIGILKAMSWTEFDVTRQIYFESLLQGLLWGIIGIILGYLIVLIIPLFGFLSVQNLILSVSPLILAVGLITSLSGGILAGILPAWRAAKLQPAETLRHF